MTATQAPFPFYDAYIDHLEPLRIEGQQPVYQDESSLPALTGSSYDAWRELEPKLGEILAQIERDGLNADFATPARLEFVWDSLMTGVAIFDSRGQLIVYTPLALLGYSGAGSDLSIQIMHYLGISQKMIVELQRSTYDSRPYKVVVSREKLVITDNVVVADHGLEVADEWMTWRMY